MAQFILQSPTHGFQGRGERHLLRPTLLCDSVYYCCWRPPSPSNDHSPLVLLPSESSPESRKSFFSIAFFGPEIVHGCLPLYILLPSVFPLSIVFSFTSLDTFIILLRSLYPGLHLPRPSLDPVSTLRNRSLALTITSPYRVANPSKD